MSRKLRIGLATIASLFILSNHPLVASAEDTNSSESSLTNEIIGENEVRDEENADYVVPSDEELNALGRYQVDLNVDENGQPFDPSGNLDGKKQFLSFRTADNEVYYIVVSYVGNSSTVNLLKDINAEDIEALSQLSQNAQAPQAGQASSEDAQNLNPPADNVEAKEADEEDDDEEKTVKSGNNSWIIIAGVFVIVLVIGFIRMRNNDNDEYDE